MSNPTSIKDSKLSTRLKGVRASWLNKHLEWRDLTDQEFRLLELYIDAAIWDEENHPNDFGKAGFTDKEVADFLGWSESKVNRKRNGLIRKGKLKMEEDRRVIPDFQKYQIKKALQLAKMQDEHAELQEQHADLQVIEPIQPSNPSPISRYKDSYKDEFNSDPNPVSSYQDSPAPENWKDYLVRKESAEELCFCRSGKNLEDCCGPSVQESLENSADMARIRVLESKNGTN